MPSLQALQTLSLGQEPGIALHVSHKVFRTQESLDYVRLGAKGDWLAVGSSAVGQLLVWEWRSESYVPYQILLDFLIFLV